MLKSYYILHHMTFTCFMKYKCVCGIFQGAAHDDIGCMCERGNLLDQALHKASKTFSG